MDRTSMLAGAALVGLALAAGCGGGDNMIAPPVSKPTAKPASTVKFTISVPVSGANSTLRRPQFDAPSGTQSITFQLASVDGVAQTSSVTVINLSASTPGCSTASGTLTCTVTVPGIAGTDVFTVISYPQADAKGTAIATGTAQVTTTAGSVTTAPVTLSGTVASIALSVQGIGLLGQSGTLPIIAIAKDASGATIMGAYASPITVTDSDTTGATKLSATSLKDSTAAASLTMSYDGSNISAVTISASATGVDSSKITNANFTPNGDYPATGGTALNYALSVTETYTHGLGTPSPTLTDSGTEVDTIATNATFNNRSNLVEITRADTGGGTLLGTATNNFYYAFTPTSAGATVHEVGWVWLPDPNNNASNNQQNSVATGSGWQLLQLPFKSGNSWDAGSGYVETSTSDSTVNGSVPSTNKGVSTWNEDGTYTNDWSNVANDGSYTGYTDVTTVKADGTSIETYTDGTGTSVTSVGTPEPAPTGTPGTVIPLTQTFTPASPGPSASPTVTLVPNWYPNGAVPSPLQSDHSTDNGSGAIPAQCNIDSSIATTAEQIHEVYTSFDPLGGTYNVTSDSYYVSGIGMVCSIQSAHYSFYDYFTGVNRTTGDYQSVQTLTLTQLKAALAKAQSMSQAGFAAGMNLQSSVLQNRDAYRNRMEATRLRLVQAQAHSHHI